jgi:uncharacterized protein (TIGR02145 family)
MKKKIAYLCSIFGFILFFLICCEKPEKQMGVSTGSVSNIQPKSADVSGVIIDMGEGISQHGHCYDTSPNTNIGSRKTELGIPAGTGGFTSILENLGSETKYYLKAYCSDGKVTTYGEEISFITLSAELPNLTTNTVTNITKTSAVSGGNISSQGGTGVIKRGVCWGIAPNPDTSYNLTKDGVGIGDFHSALTGLDPGSKYYVRAYAINLGGIAYGNEVNFTTESEKTSIPVVTTAQVTSITKTAAVCGGLVTSSGGENVTARGVCWNNSTNPIIENFKTIDSSGLGIFVSNLTGLTGNTQYYVRAYASNSTGTAYGEEKSFTTSPVLAYVSTAQITSITSTGAVCGGTLSSDGGSAVIARGVCWSLEPNPATTNNHTSDGVGIGEFTSTITNLSPGNTYYVRAYATNSIGTSYGAERNFVSGAVVPSLITNPIESINSDKATSGGNISNDGGAPVTVRGVCWGTSINPGISDSHTSDGSGSGSFNSTITGLIPGVKYYVRAYATNSAGTGYGNELNFNSLPIVPTVSTNVVSNTTHQSAVAGGEITSDGGADILARGVCWSINQNPNLSENYTNDGTGTGSFTSIISGLEPSTTYYVRAYATNSAGTSYGNQQYFQTSEAPYITVTYPKEYTHWMVNETKGIEWSTNMTGYVKITLLQRGTAKLTINGSAPNNGYYSFTVPNILTYGLDYTIKISSTTLPEIFGESPQFKISEASGKTGMVYDINNEHGYNTVKIGYTWWMAENLKSTNYNQPPLGYGEDPEPIPLVSNTSSWSSLTTAAYSYYGNNLSNLYTYGPLYNLPAVNSNRLCPEGWRIPSIQEWNSLFSYVGTQNTAGGKLKEIGTSHWQSPNTSATDEYGFTALPGGMNKGAYSGLGTKGCFWTTSDGVEEIGTNVFVSVRYYVTLRYNDAGIDVEYFSVSPQWPDVGGFSVRCVK